MSTNSLSSSDSFFAALADRELRVGVVGQGYVGLPLVIGFAEMGFDTLGFDIDDERMAALNNGVSHIEDVTSERVTAMVDLGRFRASTDADELIDCDVTFIAVPTPFDSAKVPDLGAVRAATATVAGALRPGNLIILQSTTYPGTTREVVVPILQEISGLTVGDDFHVAFSPERVDPGNPHWTLRNTPKLVGGMTEEGSARAAAVMASAMDDPDLVTIMSSPDTAEMAKLLENTYRAVNIALVNELAVLSDRMDVDLWEVIDGAATKPFGYQAFYPGIGPGGHCIPVDPYYLSWRARQYDFQTKFIDMAADTNLAMADYSIDRIGRILNEQSRSIRGAKVLVIGAAFKADVSDIRNSRAIHVIELLHGNGADLSYHDPHVSDVTVNGKQLKSVDLSDEAIRDADVVVILVNHQAVDLTPIVTGTTPVFDAIAATGRSRLAHVERL